MSTDLSRRPRSLVRENDTEAQKMLQEYSTPEGGLAFFGFDLFSMAVVQCGSDIV